MPPLVNTGVGHNPTIQELAKTVKQVIGYSSEIVFDATKPNAAPRKLLDADRLNAKGWTVKMGMREELAAAYRDFVEGTSTNSDFVIASVVCSASKRTIPAASINPNFVIASVAKQSRIFDPSTVFLDRHVAPLLAMTATSRHAPSLLAQRSNRGSSR